MADSVLQSPHLRIATAANPIFHILSEHPVHTALQRSLFEDTQLYGQRVTAGDKRAEKRIGSWIDLAVRALRSIRRAKGQNIPAGEAVIVSVLTNTAHLKQAEDFYFGSLQRYLEDRGIQPILLLVNLSGTPYHLLPLDTAAKVNPFRVVLPDAASFLGECASLITILMESLRMLVAAARLPASLKRSMLQAASKPATMRRALKNIRLFRQIHALCKIVQPRLVMTLYEGHAWERLAWKAARLSSRKVYCVGYQHTVLRKGSHAVRRLLSPNGDFDPNMVLSLGDITNSEIKKALAASGVRSVVYGTHRRLEDNMEGRYSVNNRDVLVLPEGLSEESDILIGFALQCAVRMPHIRFIIRCHPVFPVERLNRSLRDKIARYQNVLISSRKNIDDDYRRCGILLYRGSSTVIYAILNGLRPIYIDVGDGIDIDPMYAMTVWRKRVSSVTGAIEVIATEQSTNDSTHNEWREAVKYCNAYVKPLKTSAIDVMLQAANS